MDEQRDEERAVREQTTELAKTADEMEHGIEDLGDDIDDAKRTAAQRQDAPDDNIVAGDWEGASSGAQEGEAPSEAVDDR